MPAYSTCLFSNLGVQPLDALRNSLLELEPYALSHPVSCGCKSTADAPTPRALSCPFGYIRDLQSSPLLPVSWRTYTSSSSPPPVSFLSSYFQFNYDHLAALPAPFSSMERVPSQCICAVEIHGKDDKPESTRKFIFFVDKNYHIAYYEGGGETTVYKQPATSGIITEGGQAIKTASRFIGATTYDNGKQVSSPVPLLY
jgi:hypothetical protein